MCTADRCSSWFVTAKTTLAIWLRLKSIKGTYTSGGISITDMGTHNDMTAMQILRGVKTNSFSIYKHLYKTDDGCYLE